MASGFDSDGWLPPEFAEQPLELELAAATFSRPANGEALRQYLLGSWKLRRATTYSVGGISGRFEGTATFAVYPHPTRTLLSYMESGKLVPSDAQLPSSADVTESRNQLMYDFATPERVDIFFDASFADRSPEAVLPNLRFVHSLRPDTLELTDHSEGGLTYQGKLDIEAANAYLTSWSVSGPTCEGMVLSMLTREADAAGADEDM